jgi:hypothetical protein
MIRLILLACLLAAPASAQSILFADGFSAGAALVHEGGHAVYTGTAGYAAFGLFELGVAGSRVWIPEVDLQATGVGPRLTVYALHQGRGAPATLWVTGLYTHYEFSGPGADALREWGITLGARSFGTEFGASRTLALGPVLRLVPEIRGTVTLERVWMNNPNGRSLDEQSRQTQFGFGLGAGAEVGEVFGLLTPSVRFTSGGAVMGLSLALAARTRRPAGVGSTR